MKKIILMFCIAMLGMSALTSCHSVSPDADEEAVIVKKPWFIGHGGVEQQAVQTGLTWCWWQRVVITSRLFQFVTRLP